MLKMIPGVHKGYIHHSTATEQENLRFVVLLFFIATTDAAREKKYWSKLPGKVQKISLSKCRKTCQIHTLNIL